MNPTFVIRSNYFLWLASLAGSFIHLMQVDRSAKEMIRMLATPLSHLSFSARPTKSLRVCNRYRVYITSHTFWTLAVVRSNNSSGFVFRVIIYYLMQPTDDSQNKKMIRRMQQRCYSNLSSPARPSLLRVLCHLDAHLLSVRLPKSATHFEAFGIINNFLWLRLQRVIIWCR